MDTPENKEEIIAFRSEPGTGFIMANVGFFIGAFFFMFLGFLILFLAFNPDVWAASSFIAFGGILLLFPIYNIILTIINFINKQDCILYNADKKFVLYSLLGKRIIVDPKDYVSVYANFWTSNMLIFSYRLSNKKVKRIRLGYCGNRRYLRRKMAEIVKQFHEENIPEIAQ